MAIELEKIYEEDINRYINPAVAVGEMEEDYVKQEINEYIFTNEIIKELYVFLNALINKKEGKPGIWVDGYYGSGKSHFIKYAFYCLNKETRERAFQNFKEARLKAEDFDMGSEVTAANIDNLRKKLETMEVEEVMFNIDYVSRQNKKEHTITRILFNQFNKTRGYNSSNIALARLVEKRLDKEGKFEEFKNQIKQKFNGEEWRDEKIIDFVESGLTSVIEIVAGLLDNIDEDSLYHSILNEREYTIEDLTNELKEYLQTKEDDYRLIFLLDEVSQYIGRNTDLLLNLQTIIVGLSAETKNKVWLVCTAQQELEELKEATEDKTVDFGKILGRFETRISLESQDATYITQKRILGKDGEGLEVLGKYYQENEEAIKNQFRFDHQLYKNYQTIEDFNRSYPFIPYQFRLISDVFKSFADIGFVGEGIKNTERSILGITHTTAKKTKNEKVGYFISFDDFFNDRLSENLTQNARNILDRANNIEFKSDQKKFAKRVIQVLFMISNLDDSLKINFPATVDNIAFLLINDVDIVKSQLQKEVQEVLDHLVEQNIIQNSEGNYRFLDNDGIRFANVVKNTKISPNTRGKYFYNQFIKKFLRPTQDINIGNRNVKASLWIDDIQETRTGDFDIKFIVFDQADLQQRAMNIPQSELNINISEWLRSDQSFKKDFLEYCKTAEAIAENRANATGDRVKTIEKFAQVNVKLLKDLQTRFEERFVSTSYISRQQLIPAERIKTNQPKTRYDEMVNNHIEQLYKNHHWSDSYAKSNADLLEAIEKGLRESPKKEDLNLAEQEINAKIDQRSGEMNLSDVVKLFEKPPYGWKDVATLQIVFDIVRKQHRSLFSYNEELPLKEYYNKAINSSLRSSIDIKPVKEYDQKEVNLFSEALQFIFPDYSLPGNKEITNLIEDFKTFLGLHLKKVNKTKEEHPGYPFSNKVRDYHLSISQLYQSKSADKLMKLVNKQKDSLKNERDFYVRIQDFLQNNLDKYEDLKTFITTEKSNLSGLEEKIREAGQKIEEFLTQETEPAMHLPAMLKYYREIKKAIGEKLKALKENVVQQYEEVFNVLEEEQKTLNLKEANLLPSRERIIGDLQKSKDLNHLELAEAKVDDFKKEYLFLLQEEAQKREAAEKGEEYKKGIIKYSLSKNAGKTLSTPEEVDKFIEDLRNDLMVKLGKNKGSTLFLD